LQQLFLFIHILNKEEYISVGSCLLAVVGERVEAVTTVGVTVVVVVDFAKKSITPNYILYSQALNNK